MKLCAVLYSASRRHSLAKPWEASVVTPPAEFEWHGDEVPPWHRSLGPIVEEYLQELPAGSRVLDLGCGNGAVLGSFLDRGWKLVGLDFSKSGIEHARKRWPSVRFEVGDATQDLTFLGEFDAIYSTEVIEHVVLPRRFVQNCFRLLKPGGTVVLSTPYHGWLRNVHIAITNGADRHYNPLVDWGHIKFWSVDTLSSLLWESGFGSVEYRGVGRISYLWEYLVMRARKPL
jgi:SAM-dependent methyltransferase